MALLGNILWFVIGGGWLAGLLWLLSGLICCITIIGIPFGIACFRIAPFAFFPFGKELVAAEVVGEKPVAGSGIMNVIWIIFVGIWLAVSHFSTGICWCCSIIGIPFGLANFKLGMVCFAPLGKRIISTEDIKRSVPARPQ